MDASNLVVFMHINTASITEAATPNSVYNRRVLNSIADIFQQKAAVGPQRTCGHEDKQVKQAQRVPRYEPGVNSSVSHANVCVC